MAGPVGEGEVVEHRADLGVELLGRESLRAIEPDLELALVRRVGILAVLRAPDLLGDAADAADGREAGGDLPAHARGLLKRDARAQGGVGDQVVLAEVRQEPRTQCRQEHGARGSRHQQGDENPQRACMQAGDGLLLQPLAAAQPRRLRSRHVAPHEERAQRRRGAHGDQQRQADRHHEGRRQRPEERALQS